MRKLIKNMYPLFTLCKIWLVLLVICCNKVKDGEFVNFFPVMGENLLPHESFFFFFFCVWGHFRCCIFCCLAYVPKLYLREVIVKFVYTVSSSDPIPLMGSHWVCCVVVYVPKVVCFVEENVLMKTTV